MVKGKKEGTNSKEKREKEDRGKGGKKKKEALTVVLT